MTWHLPLVREELARILRAREDELRLEQAVHGLDRCDEVELQALLGRGLVATHHVTREAYYPSSTGKRSHRPRCDLVLTAPGQALQAETPPSLFERTCPPEDALWLEVKVAHQLRPGGQRNARYGQQWRASIASDLRKLKLEPRIHHGALALVAFTSDESTFERDLASFERLLMDAELLAGYVSKESFAIEERMGHACCGVAVWPLV